jgi:NAD-dependent DNA ligase
MKNFKNKCDIAYDLGNPIIIDSAYDSLFGCNASSVSTSNEETQNVILPFWMGSLDKIKTEKALSLWLRKNLADTFVVSCKLDGISALFHKNKLFTRGNGLKGSNISTFLNNLNIKTNIPAILNDEMGTTASLRGELVMKKSVFEKKYNKKFKNSRNLVAGQFTKKEIDSSIIKDIDFIAYEVINGKQELLPSVQFNLINNNFLDNVFPVQIIDRNDLAIDNLNNLFNKLVKSLDYTIDGLVITANELYTRNTSGNPKYSFAFKKQTETTSATAIVTKVQWTLSKYGIYIPVVHINPVELSGCIISKLTGHNAKYIVENKIEEDAEIVCVRSGDVIPYIVEITKPSEKTISLPTGYWEGVHIKRLSNNTNSEVEIKILTFLLVKLDVKNINIKTIEKLYNYFCSTEQNSGIDIFFKIIDTSLLPTELFRIKTHSKIIYEIVNLKSRVIQLSTLISASGLLGYGLSDKRIELLLTHLPNFLNYQPSMKELCHIDGFSSKLAQKIIDNYFSVINFIQICQGKLNIIGLNIIDDLTISSTISSTSVIRSGSSPDTQKKIKICLSGFRDKTLNDNYLILNSVTKDCEFLVIDNVERKVDDTIKVKQARKLNIPIISRLLFEKQNKSQYKK